MSNEYEGYACEKRFGKMDSKKKHPFAITCRKCGSNRVMVSALEYYDLILKCEDCGTYVSCGTYYPHKADYTDAVHNW
jgi:ribosomal protein L37AE/L43A